MFFRIREKKDKATKSVAGYAFRNTILNPRSQRELEILVPIRKFSIIEHKIRDPIRVILNCQSSSRRC